MKTFVYILMAFLPITAVAQMQVKQTAIDNTLYRTISPTIVYEDTNYPYIEIDISPASIYNSASNKLVFHLHISARFHKKRKQIPIHGLAFKFEDGFDFLLTNGELRYFSLDKSLRKIVSSFEFSKKEFEYFLGKKIEIITMLDRKGRKVAFKPINSEQILEMFNTLYDGL